MLTTRDRTIVVLGLSYKVLTGEIKEFPAIEICKILLKEGAMLCLFDPNARKEKVKQALGARYMNRMIGSDRIDWSQNLDAGVWQDAHAIVLLVEYSQVGAELGFLNT